jgi:1,2-dihydroxy-3-keto-5-methylthiopentene dioxygenase
MKLKRSDESDYQPFAFEACFEQFGVYAGHWPELSALEAECSLDKVIEAACQPLALMKSTFGYLTEDIVSLSPETPDLEAVLEKYGKEHHHTDDEVRVILQGEGIFGFSTPQGPFHLSLQTGDWIVIPAYTRHWFTLTELKHVRALRVFKETLGWEALY